MKYGITFGISALLLSTFSSQTLAHFPLMSCHIAQQKVLCEAGYSDGSTAVDYDVIMYDYDDNLIAKVATDKRSIAEFVLPKNDFYLVFDAGHENPVEVDVVEIETKP
ncbi:hypothetical protein BS333_20260 [Vibrio azureus]|uniref:Uncharacterized protein n=1 Tax=Vibrio azureus NBRC 104587 TaxID=1219077 RepID=U3C765_9VIBR|nr:hypothetical protein [Vibrio azureus]AUI88637.1 hypothetical protein BS333_20260 [Vibrio azureus]GAD77224.1 hypothetical protein VAZ01S_066_00160 [Vibrio azureus NBRC 104587]